MADLRETVERMLDALNVNDLERAYEAVAESCAYSTSEYSLTGRREIEAVDFAFFDLLESHWRTLERIIVDRDFAVAWVTFGGTGRQSGRTFEIDVCNVFRIAEGAIVEWQMYGDFEAARRAVA